MCIDQIPRKYTQWPTIQSNDLKHKKVQSRHSTNHTIKQFLELMIQFDDVKRAKINCE